MRCRFAHDDAAYVLGALSPGERLEFERHLRGCEECTGAVRELAGLPGLLGRVDPDVLEDPPGDLPVPATLLPDLSREVVRRRRRRTATAAAVATAASAVLAVGTTLLVTRLDDGDAPGAAQTATPSASGTDSPSAVPEQAMAPVGEVPVRATLGLEQVTWGTRLLLTCSYDPEGVDYELPPEVDYTLFVRTRQGRTEQVGSWRSVGGTTMRLAAATSAKHADIASVEVRTPDGRVVLRSDA